MRKLILSSLAVLAFTATANAEAWVCNADINLSDKNPVVATRVVIHETPNEWTKFKFGVVHLLLNGEERDRWQQYRDITIHHRFLPEGQQVLWTGTLIRDPRTTIIGKFDLNEDRVSYTELWFDRGKYDHSQTSYCQLEEPRPTQPWWRGM